MTVEPTARTARRCCATCYASRGTGSSAGAMHFGFPRLTCCIRDKPRALRAPCAVALRVPPPVVRCERANAKTAKHANEGAHTHGNEPACCQTNRRARHRPSEHGSMRTRPKGARRAAPPTGAGLCCPRDAGRASKRRGPFRRDGAPETARRSTFEVSLAREGINGARITHRL